jgi:FKBP-type peptidyl-prolyl cis-trans isomerase SlyD
MTGTQLKVADGLVVGLDYKVTLGDDLVVGSSSGREPLEFLQGHDQIVPGLEQALYGMTVGDERDVMVSPADGYGERDPNAFQLVPLDAFPSDIELKPGLRLNMRDDAGEVFEVFVAEVRPDDVLLDFNHPLAGETLHFSVKVVTLRPATSEELAHGHVHDIEHGH